jgi:hypothetical protein
MPHTARLDSRLPRSHTVLVGLLTVAVVLPFLLGLAVTDTARDFANASAIALGQSLPLLGPSINGTWALGPVWFYLLAVPLLVSAEFLLLPLWMGLIVALKVPLAAMLGSRLAGSAGGLTLAALVALPGWWWVGALTPTHASAIEAAVLGCLLLALPVRREGRPLRAGRWFAIGLCFSLSLHAHPTAVMVAPLLAYLLWPQRRDWRGALAAICGGMIPLLPVAWDSLQRGPTQVDASLRYFTSGDYGQRLREIPTDIAGLLLRGETYADSLLQQTAEPLPVFAIASLLLIGLAAAGAWRRARAGDYRLAALWLYLLLASAAISLLRNSVPPWMIFALLPLLAVLKLGALQAIAPAQRARAAMLVYLLSLGGLGAHAIAMTQARGIGLLYMPISLHTDLWPPDLSRDDQRAYLPLLDVGRLSRRLCPRGADSWRLHGELAALVQMGDAAAAALVCDGAAPLIGGAGPGQHLVGLPSGAARRLGLIDTDPGSDASRRFGGFALLTPTAVVHPPEGVPLRLDPRYLPERLAALEARGVLKRDITTDCPRGEWLVVVDLGHTLNALLVQFERAGHIVPPAHANWLSRLWRCDGEPVQLRISALQPELVDVFRLRAGTIEHSAD